MLSHVRIGATPEALHAVRLGAGGADLLIGCDLVVGASAEALARLEPGSTRAVVNSTRPSPATSRGSPTSPSPPTR